MRSDQYKIETLMRDYQAVFKGQSTSQQGLRVLFDILNKCGIYTVNTKNSHEAAVLEGKRSIGVLIMQMVEMAPQYNVPLSHEHMEEFSKSASIAKDYHDVIEHQAKQQDETKEDNK